MPKAFDDCKNSGGKIITKVPEPGKYLHICYPKGGGSPIAGEVKTTVKKRIWKKK
jgi:hypothetical protein